jgi:hypothetical protein
MSDTTTRIPQLVHTTTATATQNASILFSEGRKSTGVGDLRGDAESERVGKAEVYHIFLARSIASIGKRGFGVVNSVFWCN